MRKSFIIVLSIMGVLFIFFITLFAIQTAFENDGNKATIISGILSMLGGFAGAMGAYLVAMNQMNKQFEHEKKKDENKKLEQMLLFLLKLKKLNKDILSLINIINKEFDEEYREKNIVYKLKVRELDILWIIKKVDSISDGFLKEEYNSEFFDFNRGIQNLYIEFMAYQLSPDQSNYLKEFRDGLNEKVAGFKSFDKYLEEQIEKIKIKNKL